MGLWKFIKRLFSEDKPRRNRKSKYSTFESEKPTRRPYSGQCEFQGCHNKPTGLDVYFCRYCEEYHCPKHRIAEDHECIGNPKSLEKKGVVSYSRR